MINKKSEPAVPIKIRIVGPAIEIEQFTDELIESLDSLQLIERSKPYPSRPPQEDQSRVYLTFIKKHE